MSAAAEIWRQIATHAKVTPPRKPPAPAARWELPDVPEEISLVHQLFFPAPTVVRKSVMLVAADQQFGPSRICERIANTLSNISGQNALIVERDKAAIGVDQVTAPVNELGHLSWQAYARPVSPSVWRIPSSFVSSEVGRNGNWNGARLHELRSAFEYLLFSTTVSEGEAPALSRMCDAVVLVITANVTRREAALRVKDSLLRQRVNFIGAVLDQRTLPIPEPIYRWL
jgi:hypothetical protein